MYDEKLSQVALSLVPGIGDILIKQLIAYCGTASQVFRERKGKLSSIPGIGRVLSSSIQPNLFQAAEKLIRKAEESRTQLLFYTEDAYPDRLKQIHAAPALLWYKGSHVNDFKKIIAIVGSRKATSYGKSVVEELIQGLKKHGACIVSGLAYGVDIAAHRSAMAAKLPTIAVIAGGLNNIYPERHYKEVKQMQEWGGVMTEHAWDIQPEAHHFPRRNRIIAGMSDAVIVIEAAAKGGALITAEYAFSFDKDIFAVPGNLDQKYSEGCNRLIETLKANMYTGIESIEKVLNWDMDKPVPISEHAESLTNEEFQVLEVLGKNKKGMAIDELCWRTQTSIHQLAVILLNLEFKGIVKALPGNFYKMN